MAKGREEITKGEQASRVASGLHVLSCDYCDKPATVNDLDTDSYLCDDHAAIPPCAASMGCLCAGHARGNPAATPCNTDED